MNYPYTHVILSIFKIGQFMYIGLKPNLPPSFIYIFAFADLAS